MMIIKYVHTLCASAHSRPPSLSPTCAIAHAHAARSPTNARPAAPRPTPHRTLLDHTAQPY